MAPSKRQVETKENVSKSVKMSEKLLLAAQQQSTNSRLLIAAAVPKKKRTMTTRRKARITCDLVIKPDKSKDEKTDHKVEVNEQAEPVTGADAAVDHKGTQRAAAGKGDKTVSGNAAAGRGKVLIIEHCKRCRTIKMTANLVKEALEIAVPDVQVIVNPVKPRERSLQIREEGGRIFLSLLEMKRPFAPMKNLNMDEVISDIINKIL